MLNSVGFFFPVPHLHVKVPIVHSWYPLDHFFLCIVWRSCTFMVKPVFFNMTDKAPDRLATGNLSSVSHPPPWTSAPLTAYTEFISTLYTVSSIPRIVVLKQGSLPRPVGTYSTFSHGPYLPLWPNASCLSSALLRCNFLFRLSSCTSQVWRHIPSSTFECHDALHSASSFPVYLVIVPFSRLQSPLRAEAVFCFSQHSTLGVRVT